MKSIVVMYDFIKSSSLGNNILIIQAPDKYVFNLKLFHYVSPDKYATSDHLESDYLDTPSDNLRISVNPDSIVYFRI